MTTARTETGILLAPSTHLPMTVAVFAVTFAYLLLRVPGADLFIASDDQGYQMALGMAVATGRYPGLDFVTQYGPLVAIASYVGWALTGSVVGEILLCAGGYAAAIALAYRFLARHTNVLVALIGSLALLAFFPRFYKWYFWLFPIIAVVLADRYAALRLASGSRSARARLLVAWGLTVGVAGLFRYDLLLEGIVYGATVIVVLDLASDRWWVRDARGVVRDLSIYVAGCLTLPLAFVALVLTLRGPQQLLLVWRSVLDGATDTVTYYLVAPFRFSMPIVSADNALAALQLGIPILYLACIAWAVTGLRSPKREQRAAAAPMLCSSLMGLGLFPQALHRADIAHLLQVIAPTVIVLALLIDVAFRVETRPRTKRRAATAIVAGGILLLPVTIRSESDLGSPLRNQFAVWDYLIGLPDSARTNTIADMAAAVRALTPPDSTVFLVMPQTKMPLLYFARRHQPGILPTYEVGMFSDAFWLERNEAALRAEPPDYLVLPRPGAPQQLTGFPAPYLPMLLAEWQQTYRRVVYENPHFLLLARSPQ